jgi:hypothetical protein
MGLTRRSCEETGVKAKAKAKAEAKAKAKADGAVIPRSGSDIVKWEPVPLPCPSFPAPA